MSPATMLISCSLSIFLILFNDAYGQAPKKRFEYKLSFKGPHLVQRDNSVPFWEYFGDALAGDEGIRITPSLRSKKGSVWSKNKLESAGGWEIEAGLRVTGRGRVGADGMAIWFTEGRASASDNPTDQGVFGAADRWNGMGVFLDSFDNDGQHNNPYIMTVTNDGSFNYDHQNDGSSQSLGGCLRDFRNKPYPVRVKIEYYNRVLSVKVNNGLTNNPNEFELCMSASNIVLPQAGYIGVSAATGGLADDHDVLYMLTHSLSDPSSDQAQVSEEERLKFEKEFEAYQQELNQAKEQYRQEHPDEVPDLDGDEESYFQSQNEKEMKQIFDGQNMIHSVMKELNRKLDELMGRQEMVLSRVNQIPMGGAGQQPPPPQQQIGQQQQGGGVASQDIQRLIQNQNNVLQQIADMRYIVNDISAKAQNIERTAGQKSGGAGDTYALNEVKDRMTAVSAQIQNLANRPQPQLSCPPPPTGSCLSSTFFFIGLAVQMVVTVGYMVYRSNKEAQAKKFF